MTRSTTPSFARELPRVLVGADERHLLIRLDAARQAYNAAPGESLRRLKLLREPEEYTVPTRCRIAPTLGAPPVPSLSANWTSAFGCANTIATPMPRSPGDAGLASTSMQTPSRPPHGLVLDNHHLSM